MALASFTFATGVCKGRTDLPQGGGAGGKLDYLAIILLAGAAGLILGLFWGPIGVTAAIGVICYFIVAIVFHIRADDAKNLPIPLMIAVLAAIALILRLTTL